MSEASRAFDPREARDPHSGKWITAGVGQAGFLHGKAVVGKHISGKDVHGVYRGGGYVAPSSGGVPVKVTHIRPDRGRARTTTVTQSTGKGLPPTTFVHHEPARQPNEPSPLPRGQRREEFNPPKGEGGSVPAEKIRKGHYVQIGGVTHKVLQTQKHPDYPGQIRLHVARKEDMGKRRRLMTIHGKNAMTVLGDVGKKLEKSLQLGSAVEPLMRAYDPHELRGLHTGQWIRAGVGQADHLHGRPVLAHGLSGRPVAGTYQGKGYVKPAGGGPAVPVQDVQHGWLRQSEAGHLDGKYVKGLTDRGPMGGRYNAKNSTVSGPFKGSEIPVSAVIPDPNEGKIRPEDESPTTLPKWARKPVDPGNYGGPGINYPPKHKHGLFRTAETATASTVHEPVGKPGGPGLWHHKTWQLPAYIQHVANDLKESGHDESRAVSMAIGIVRNWSEGHNGKGGHVSADVQAAASKAIAEWEALKARTHAKRSTTMPEHDADGLDASWDGELDDLDLTGLRMEDLDAAAAEDEQTFGGWLAAGDAQRLAKLGSGGRFAALKAKLAAKGIDDPGALAAKIGRAKFGKKRFHALAAAGRRRTAPAAAAARAGELFRTYALEDCRIMTRAEGAGSGRIVEAYAAVFDTPAEIRDHQGHYLEEIHRNAFDQAIGSAHPDRNGGMWRVAVLYNHGLTVHGSPAERFSMPAGVPVDIQAEARGLLTRTEYAQTPLGEEILELVRMGALRSQSFTGGIGRSEPGLRGPGDKYRPQGTGLLQRVRRYVLGLREYGLTPFPAYSGAEVCGVRMQLPDGYDGLDEVEPFGEIEGDEGVTEWEDDATGYSPEVEDSPASTGHRLYQLRSESLLRGAGIELRGR